MRTRDPADTISRRSTPIRVCCLALVAAGSIAAQDQLPFLRVAGVDVTGSVRARAENWNWFDTPGAQSSYVYGSALLRLAVRKAWDKVEFQAESSFPLFVSLPHRAIAPDPIGPLGYGGDYYAANGRSNLAAAVLRQAFLRTKLANGRLSLRVGRFEFADGAEAVPGDVNLAALKRDRINQRLIGIFNYALRSFDGVQAGYDFGRSNVTGIFARVVEGSFQLRALDEINVELGYGAFTRYFERPNDVSELRLFTLFYRDGRGLLKVDNRPAALLQADVRPIAIATPGLHYIRERKLGPGRADAVLWGAAQEGQWGRQSQLAGELAVEAGYLFPAGIQPWIRIGYLRSSGDSVPSDDRHSTFFQVLSSPRAYARFPFYILMNTDDRFVQFRANPARKLAVRAEAHRVRLSSSKDLWYDGGGPFQESTFGYIGRPSGGRAGIGTAFDISADYSISAATTISFYGGAARGALVPELLFPTGGRKPVPSVFSIEVAHRF